MKQQAVHERQGAAANRLHLARVLARLPLTQAALAAGIIDLAKARAVAEAVSTLTEDQARAVEARVLVKAPDQPVSRFRQCLRRAVLRADPAAAQARHERAVADRRVVHSPAEDGIGELWLRGPADPDTGNPDTGDPDTGDPDTGAASTTGGPTGAAGQYGGGRDGPRSCSTSPCPPRPSLAPVRILPTSLATAPSPLARPGASTSTPCCAGSCCTPPPAPYSTSMPRPTPPPLP